MLSLHQIFNSAQGGRGGQAAVIDGLSLAAVQTWLRGISKSRDRSFQEDTKININVNYAYENIVKNWRRNLKWEKK